jgi:putative phage-type endonuclease
MAVGRMTTTLLDAPPANTPEWVEWRKGGLGASDLAAVMGLDPYTTEHELWELKTGRVPAFTGNAKTRWGHRMETVGIHEWSEANRDYVVASNTKPFRNPRWPHLWATPDGLGIGADETVGIEVKITSAWVHPPERVRVQNLASIGICEFARQDVVRLNFDEDPAIFRIERDEAAIESILAAGEAWYVLHVLEGVEPPRRPDEAPADERQAGLAADLRRVRQAIAQLERQESAIRDDLIASVAGQGVITGSGFRIEVRRVKGSTRTSWKDLAADYRGLIDLTDDELDAITAKHQTYGNPSTRLEAHWSEEDATA